jgi:hypothetical protein
MFNRNWKQARGKIHDTQNKRRKSRRNQNTTDEIRSAFKDEEKLKRNKKRLSFDWFFRPEGD